MMLSLRGLIVSTFLLFPCVGGSVTTALQNLGQEVLDEKIEDVREQARSGLIQNQTKVQQVENALDAHKRFVASEDRRLQQRAEILEGKAVRARTILQDVSSRLQAVESTLGIAAGKIANIGACAGAKQFYSASANRCISLYASAVTRNFILDSSTIAWGYNKTLRFPATVGQEIGKATNVSLMVHMTSGWGNSWATLKMGDSISSASGQSCHGSSKGFCMNCSFTSGNRNLRCSIGRTGKKSKATPYVDKVNLTYTLFEIK